MRRSGDDLRELFLTPVTDVRVRPVEPGEQIGECLALGRAAESVV
jgi:hypothetical protein